jgi:predicted nucleic acid-binding Zn ribbon protein
VGIISGVEGIVRHLENILSKEYKRKVDIKKAIFMVVLGIVVAAVLLRRFYQLIR